MYILFILQNFKNLVTDLLMMDDYAFIEFTNPNSAQ